MQYERVTEKYCSSSAVRAATRRPRKAMTAMPMLLLLQQVGKRCRGIVSELGGVRRVRFRCFVVREARVPAHLRVLSLVRRPAVHQQQVRQGASEQRGIRSKFYWRAEAV